VHTRGKWHPGDHLIYLDEKLREIAAGRIKRLMVFMPPRHGKSELISKYFSAWYLGTFPDNHVILVSYEADFAASWGRKAREVLDELRDDFGVTVNKESSAAKRLEIKGHNGGMDAAEPMGLSLAKVPMCSSSMTRSKMRKRRTHLCSAKNFGIGINQPHLRVWNRTVRLY
jgi:hypothetical protein